MFQKTSAAFDEGGTSGLLLGSLRCLDDFCGLVLDSNTVVTSEKDSVSTQKEHNMIDLTEFKGTGIGRYGLAIYYLELF